MFSYSVPDNHTPSPRSNSSSRSYSKPMVNSPPKDLASSLVFLQTSRPVKRAQAAALARATLPSPPQTAERSPALRRTASTRRPSTAPGNPGPYTFPSSFPFDSTQPLSTDFTFTITPDFDQMMVLPPLPDFAGSDPNTFQGTSTYVQPETINPRALHGDLLVAQPQTFSSSTVGQSSSQMTDQQFQEFLASLTPTDVSQTKKRQGSPSLDVDPTKRSRSNYPYTPYTPPSSAESLSMSPLASFTTLHNDLTPDAAHFISRLAINNYSVDHLVSNPDYLEGSKRLKRALTDNTVDVLDRALNLSSQVGNNWGLDINGLVSNVNEETKPAKDVLASVYQAKGSIEAQTLYRSMQLLVFGDLRHSMTTQQR